MIWDRFFALCGNDGTLFHTREEGNDGIIRVPSGDECGVVGAHVWPQESPVCSPEVAEDGERRLAVIEQQRVAKVREKDSETAAEIVARSAMTVDIKRSKAVSLLL
jgi:hypothetical protein